jgi:hypothetical protein
MIARGNYDQGFWQRAWRIKVVAMRPHSCSRSRNDVIE